MTTRKDRIQAYLISTAFLLIPLLLLLWYYFLHTPESMYRNYGTFMQIEEDPDSAYLHSLENLPYWTYRYKADSIHNLQQAAATHLVTAVFAYPFGVGSYLECDTCTDMRWGDWKLMAKNKYYLLLGGFKQDEKRTEDLFYKPVYYKKLGQSYLKYVQYDTIYDAGRRQVKGYKGHWVSKPIRYQAQRELGSHDDEMHLMIPVSKTTYGVLQITMFVILGLGLVLLWLAFRKFVQVLVEIAKGNAFTVRNYQRLFFIANVVGGIVLSALLARLVMQWSFKSYYRDDLSITVNWVQNGKWLVVALAVYFIARAFKKGHDIQQEQDLTI